MGRHLSVSASTAAAYFRSSRHAQYPTPSSRTVFLFHILVLGFPWCSGALRKTHEGVDSNQHDSSSSSRCFSQRELSSYPAGLLMHCSSIADSKRDIRMISRRPRYQTSMSVNPRVLNCRIRSTSLLICRYRTTIGSATMPTKSAIFHIISHAPREMSFDPVTRFLDVLAVCCIGGSPLRQHQTQLAYLPSVPEPPHNHAKLRESIDSFPVTHIMQQLRPLRFSCHEETFSPIQLESGS